MRKRKGIALGWPGGASRVKIHPAFWLCPWLRPDNTSPMIVAWTTVGTRADADRLAQGAVERRLAACAQIDGPITSHYHWEGRLERSEEFRIWFKCLPANASLLSAWVHNHHPYATPQWIEVSAEVVGEKYLSWAMANSTPAPFPTSNQP